MPRGWLLPDRRRLLVAASCYTEARGNRKARLGHGRQPRALDADQSGADSVRVADSHTMYSSTA